MNYNMTDISSWLLKTIAKKRSIQGEYFLLYGSCDWNSCMNDYVFHNAHVGEDKTLIIHVANSITMLEFENMMWK